MSLYSLSFFKFINFLPRCLISLSTSCRSLVVLIFNSRSPAMHIFLVSNIMLYNEINACIPILNILHTSS